MAETREKLDQRLERLENTERERLGVLKEMKDLMGVWVECMKKSTRMSHRVMPALCEHICFVNVTELVNYCY